MASDHDRDATEGVEAVTAGGSSPSISRAPEEGVGGCDPSTTPAPDFSDANVEIPVEAVFFQGNPPNHAMVAQNDEPNVGETRARSASPLTEEKKEPAELDLPPPPDVPHVPGATVSLRDEGDFECPICYLVLCEPVKAPGCKFHVFCKNCLLKSQRASWNSRLPKCPVCRAECPQAEANNPLEEATELVATLRALDAEYDARAQAAVKEREEHKEKLARVLSHFLPDSRQQGQFEVFGAGSPEVNGVYVAGVLPTYLGPTVYRKPNTSLFIFRWHQRHWVISELRGPYSMGNEREWVYVAPTVDPPGIPPGGGWEVPSRGRGEHPPPEVRMVSTGGAGAGAPGSAEALSNSASLGALTASADDTLRVIDALAAVMSRPDEDSRSRSGSRGSASRSRSGSRPPQCRCTPKCTVM